MFLELQSIAGATTLVQNRRMRPGKILCLCWSLALSALVGCTTSDPVRDAARGAADTRTNDDGAASGDTVISPEAGDHSAGDDRRDVAAEAPASVDGADVPVEAPTDAAPASDGRDAAKEVVTISDAHDAALDVVMASDAHDAAVDSGIKNDSSDVVSSSDAGDASPGGDVSHAGDAAVDQLASGDVNDGSTPEAVDSPGETASDAQPDAPPDAPPDLAPASVSVATHDVGVENKGTVFNVADDYFNDGFIPPTPVANFGLHSQIITVASDDGSLDVAWLDYATGKSAPWALPAPGPINITHVDAALTTATTTATGISSYKLLGFTKDPGGNFYLGYNKDHPFKTSTPGDQNNINGNELHVVKLAGAGATAVWDRLIFGDQDNNNEATLGDPGGAANGILGYDTTNSRIVLYLGHSMMWFSATQPPTRHQAGFFRLLNPDSGAIVPPSGNDVIHFGAGWWYSHSFNQRLIIDGGNYYVLAHGDAFPRQLGFARWSLTGYTTRNSTDFDQPYWTIAGNTGDNKTDAQTGQFVRMADGRFLIVHTSSQGRSARDVRLVFCDGATGVAAASAAVWLTSNQGTVQATMPKVERLGDDVLVTYALWDSTGRHKLTWYAAVLDQTLNVVVAPTIMTNVEFVDSAPLFRFKGGPNAGAVAWVSGNASHTLSVHVATLGR